MNVVGLGWTSPLLTANFGEGYGSGILAGSSAGLHNWLLSAEVIPDTNHLIDYEIESVPLSDARFTYFFEFIKRHVALGDKPFIIQDPRTQKKFLVSFKTGGFDFEQITATLFRGGLILYQRRANDLLYFDDGSICFYSTISDGDGNLVTDSSGNAIIVLT